MLYIVPPSISVTPITTYADALAAASPIRCRVGPGTLTAFAWRRCTNSVSLHAGVRQTQSGYAGMKDSGKTISSAP